MKVSIALWFLLGCLCARVSFQASKMDTRGCYCRYLADSARKKGDVITAEIHHRSQKSYCGGSEFGEFLAVEKKALFHLVCELGDNPKKATAKITKFDPRALTQTFEESEYCLRTNALKPLTGEQGRNLASRLAGISVPYNCTSCNANHYFEYLSAGRVENPSVVMDLCPVFQAFNASSDVKSTDFRLAGRNNRYYDWPTTSLGGNPPRNGPKGNLELTRSRSNNNFSPQRLVKHLSQKLRRTFSKDRSFRGTENPDRGSFRDGRTRSRLGDDRYYSDASVSKKNKFFSKSKSLDSPRRS